jgi:hypothetical protein
MSLLSNTLVVASRSGQKGSEYQQLSDKVMAIKNKQWRIILGNLKSSSTIALKDNHKH